MLQERAEEARFVARADAATVAASDSGLFLWIAGMDIGCRIAILTDSCGKEAIAIYRTPGRSAPDTYNDTYHSSIRQCPSDGMR